jgi:hypothetical protein
MERQYKAIGCLWVGSDARSIRFPETTSLPRDTASFYEAFPRAEEIVIENPSVPVNLSIPIITIVLHNSFLTRHSVIPAGASIGELRIRVDVSCRGVNLPSLIAPSATVRRLVLDWEPDNLSWSDVMSVDGLQELEVISPWNVGSARSMLAAAARHGVRSIVCRELVYEDDVVGEEVPVPEFMIAGLGSRGRVRGFPQRAYKFPGFRAAEHVILDGSPCVCIPSVDVTIMETRRPIRYEYHDKAILDQLVEGIRDVTIMASGELGLRRVLTTLPASMRSLTVHLDLQTDARVWRDFFRARVIPRFEAMYGVGSYSEVAHKEHWKSLVRVRACRALLRIGLRNDCARMVAEMLPLL